MMESPDTDFMGRQSYVKDAAVEIRRGFVRKVYGILTVQLLLTVAIAAPLSQAQIFVRNNTWLLGLSMIATLGAICAMTCCQQTTRMYPQNYVCLFIFTFFEAILVGFISAAYTPQSVVLAAATTVLIFGCMTVYAWKTDTDFTGFGPYIFAAMMAMMCFGFMLMILSMCGVSIEWGMMLYDLMGIVIFTFYIVFDTQMILGEWGGHKIQFGVDDYVFAALNLYLDIINLFIYLLRLFGERERR